MVKANEELKKLKNVEKVEKVQKTLYVNKEHSDKLNILKEETGRDLSELIRIALSEFLDKFEFEENESQNYKNGGIHNAEKR